MLMKLGACHVESPFIEVGQISTSFYFSYFLIFVPIASLIENTLADIQFLPL
jgi:ubiquinol-cytochrome c reductase cytochrome b subunit